MSMSRRTAHAVAGDRDERIAAREVAALTPRELEVLRLIARGLDNRGIADQLVLSTATVKSHVNRVFLKLGVRDRAQAVIAAYETGVVEPRFSTPGLRDATPPSPMDNENNPR